ncbi:hypothetical protein ISF_04350 [Cordyceps fumosorosea ARSEF 2679]|uniref:Uncharacterized protein n=1 Tax=Cordyceps fumosorosea (strain ARSEF 2679) TaxID=1081104 RepID=A0A162MPN8_CORFA|nr:hypothetical protein ISF_04350 [Cordyceps fumosorosea ARSEF 2679]OAA64940.1 hypothetical protein ISF_04350 [Cordyceps fumosorosea ARSEF 2679]
MEKMAVRNAIQCPYGTRWYSCSGGGTSCCSVDPCHLKRCPDAPPQRANASSTSSSPTARPSYTNSSSSTTAPSSSTSDSPTMGPDPTRSLVPTDEAADEAATSTESSTSSSSPPPRSPSSSSPPSRLSAQSDSGVTRTIPNDSTVTVTRHTTITRELSSIGTDSLAPSFTTTTELGADATSSSSIVETQPLPTSTSPPSQDANPGINTGAVAGIAVGGVCAAALLVVLLWLWKRRRNNRVAEEAADNLSDHAPVVAAVDKSRLRDSIFGRRPTPPTSLPPHPTPQHHHQASTGQGYGYDPFAPFGGRADQPARRNSPLPPHHPDTFEMDGRGVHVVELPSTPVAAAAGARVRQDSPRRVGGGGAARVVGVVKQRPSSDPHATLNHLPRHNGRPTYINQWNQYKVLSGEIHPPRR